MSALKTPASKHSTCPPMYVWLSSRWPYGGNKDVDRGDEEDRDRDRDRDGDDDNEIDNDNDEKRDKDD